MAHVQLIHLKTGQYYTSRDAGVVCLYYLIQRIGHWSRLWHIQDCVLKGALLLLQILPTSL